MQVVEDPEAEKLMDDPNSARILYILREGELSAKQIHSRFNAGFEKKKTLTSIYRYLTQLQKNGYIEVSREELKKNHMIVKYYARTARFFLSSERHVCEEMKNEIDAASSIYASIYKLDVKKVKERILEIMRDENDLSIKIFEDYGSVFLEEEKKFGWEKTQHALKLIWPLIEEKEKKLVTKTLALLEKST